MCMRPEFKSKTGNCLATTRQAIRDSYSEFSRKDLLIELKAQFESRYAFERALKRDEAGLTEKHLLELEKEVWG